MRASRHRGGRASRALAVVMAAIACESALAQEQSAPPPQPWTVNCAASGGAKELTCAMRQVLRTKAGQRVLTVGVERAPGQRPVLVVALPHGVDLTKGAQVSIDQGQPITVAVATADAAGSYARVEASDDLLASLREGRLLNVAFTAANGQRIETQVSLNGFRAAYGKL